MKGWDSEGAGLGKGLVSEQWCGEGVGSDWIGQCKVG